MKLGINTYTYMWGIGFEGARPAAPLTAIGLLEKAHALGVKVVQTGPNLPLDRLSEAELDAFVRQAQAWGIELELGTRGLETAHLARQIALARRIGATLLRTVPELDGQPPAPAEIFAYLTAIRPLLEREGVRLGLENGNTPALDLKAALDAVGSPQIGIVLDMVNSLGVSEGWRYVTEILAPYTVCLHLKDFAIRRAWNMMGFIVEGRPAGNGQLDLPWLFAALKAARADFNVIIELWPPEQKTLTETIALEQAWAEESVSNLRAFVRA
jgi:sugar phosphate isomerase/epimerase